MLAESPSTYRRVIGALTDALTDADVRAPRRTAEWMLMDVVGGSRAQIYAHFERMVGEDDLTLLQDMLDRRLRHEPLQYILGYTEFFGLRLQVSPAVLIPRPETECVVEYLLEHIGDVDRPRVLDIGTGSGCIALAVARERRDACVIGCDNSSEALQIARMNTRELALPVELREADITASDFFSGERRSFDAVVSNPPYVTPGERPALDPEVREYEPERALFTTEDPLHFYRLIAEEGRRLLKPDGWLVFETHADYGADVAALLEQHGYETVDLHDDRAGRPRVAVGRRG